MRERQREWATRELRKETVRMGHARAKEREREREWATRELERERERERERAREREREIWSGCGHPPPAEVTAVSAQGGRGEHACVFNECPAWLS